MRQVELAQLELFARTDELLRQMTEWSERSFGWEPLDHCRALIRRALPRLQQLQVRLEAPLVVATFGGTGTGKSSLVNALAGSEVTRAGRERPTTRRPVLVAHQATELSSLHLPLEQFDVVQLDSPVLRDVVILDCPDPDTNEAALSGSNLETLRRLLPRCDVLLCVSTQQKYRSARIVDELDVAATGCRLIFVQTHAEQDEDIRGDWEKQLRPHYEVPELFFVDSVRALREQQSGQRPTGDFARLQSLLTTRLAAGQRVQVRRANLLDLSAAVLSRCQTILEDAQPRLTELRTAVQEQQQRLRCEMAERLRSQLESNRHLWEQRILTSVTSRIGVSPFSSLLRVYNGLGTLLTSASLFRARTGAQMLLIGAVQGTRWWTARQKEKEASDRFEELATPGLNDDLLREARLIIRGHLLDAGLTAVLADDSKAANQVSGQIEAEFLNAARGRVDQAIDQLAKRNSGLLIRCVYEVLLMLFVVYVLYRAGKNFFWDTFLRPEARVLPIDFYFSAGLFFVLWSSLLVMAFARRMRRGLQREINALAQELAEDRSGGPLFPAIHQTLHVIEEHQQRMRLLDAQCQELRDELATSPELGSQKHSVREIVG